MSSPLISIVMPAYNAEKFIRKSIDSILAQTYTNFELLVADDCSKDNTRAVIESYTDPRIKLHHNAENSGYLKTCNKLLGLSKGEYLSFMDADDYSHPERFAIQLQTLQNNPDYAVCGCNLLYVDEEGNELYCSKFVGNSDEIRETMLNGEFLYSPNTYLFPREVGETVGFYHPYFDRIGAEDYYWTALIIQKYKIINIPQALYYYRFNPASISGDLSDNPKKLFSSNVVRRLHEQRVKTGTDDLEQGRLNDLNDFVSNLIAPYVKDYSAFLKTLAQRSFNNGDKGKAINYMWRAIAKKPLHVAYYRDLLYMLRTKA